MNTLTLAYDEYGDHDKPALIILHGFFASSRNWRSIARKLQQDFHIFVPDQRNHGASPHAQPMDYPSMAEDMVHFLQQHNLKKAHFLGHSMGGKVAMLLALNKPEVIDKLIVADISPSNYQHSFDHTIQALKNTLRRKGIVNLSLIRYTVVSRDGMKKLVVRLQKY